MSDEGDYSTMSSTTKARGGDRKQ